MAHKDQGRVQILIVFLEKFFIVLVGYLAIVCVESSLMVFLNQRDVLFLTAGGLSGGMFRH